MQNWRHPKRLVSFMKFQWYTKIQNKIYFWKIAITIFNQVSVQGIGFAGVLFFVCFIKRKHTDKSVQAHQDRKYFGPDKQQNIWYLTPQDLNFKFHIRPKAANHNILWYVSRASRPLSWWTAWRGGWQHQHPVSCWLQKWRTTMLTWSNLDHSTSHQLEMSKSYWNLPIK